MASRSRGARFLTRLWVIAAALWVAGGIVEQVRDYSKQQEEYGRKIAGEIGYVENTLAKSDQEYADNIFKEYVDKTFNSKVNGEHKQDARCGEIMRGLPSSDLAEPNFIHGIVDAEKNELIHQAPCPVLWFIYNGHKPQILSFAEWDVSKFHVNWPLLALTVVFPITLYGLGAAFFWAFGPLRE